MKTPTAGAAGSWARMAAVSALALSLAALPSHTALAQQPPLTAVDAPALSLLDALARAADVDPALAGGEARARAGDAAVRQADVRPNPSLGLMVENLPTLGGGNIIDRTETTLSYEQRFERGGDRPARVALARGEAAVVQAEAAVRRLDRLEQV
ncbi:MAG: TolC family protein, partial [Alphaproteobacteria bacterium]|nr:TolC family protein [Alphaproteobacteria bacterium]